MRCACGGVFDAHGRHALSCIRLTATVRTYVHDKVGEVLHELLRWAGITTRREVRGFFNREGRGPAVTAGEGSEGDSDSSGAEYTSKRPDLVAYTYPDPKRSTIVFEITLCNEDSPASLQRDGDVAPALMRSAERKKERKYTQLALANQASFQPVVLTLGGRWSAATRRTIEELVCHGTQRHAWTPAAAAQWWRARISVQLQDAVGTALDIAVREASRRHGPRPLRADGPDIHQAMEFAAEGQGTWR